MRFGSFLLAGSLLFSVLPATSLAAAPTVAPLTTLRDAEAYAASRGVVLSEPRAGAHATREGHTLYDETVYRANGAQPLTVLRFADATTARDMASVVVEADPAARALIRGQIVFLVSGNADLLARLTAAPAVPTTFADAETLLASHGLAIAARVPVEPTSGPSSIASRAKRRPRDSATARRRTAITRSRAVHSCSSSPAVQAMPARASSICSPRAEPKKFNRRKQCSMPEMQRPTSK